MMWRKPGFLRLSRLNSEAALPRIMPCRASIRCFDLCETNRKSGDNDEPVRYPCERGCQSHAAPAAALGWRWRLCAVAGGWQPTADRPRYDVADHGRRVDRRSSRGAGNRRVFFYQARSALDLDAMAGSGSVRKDLRGVWLERAGGALRRRDRRLLWAFGKIPEPAFERKHDPGVRRRGAGIDRAASVGAAACARDANNDGVGRWPGRSRGPSRCSVFRAAALDG